MALGEVLYMDEAHENLEKFECNDCGCTSWAEDKAVFKCPFCAWTGQGETKYQEKG